MNDDEFEQEMARLRAGYLERLNEIRSELLGAAQAADTRLILQLAHRLKGSAGSYGFAGLSAVAGDVEALLLDEVDADLQVALQPLLQTIDEVRG